MFKESSLTLSALAAATLANGAVIFDENFQGIAADTNISTSNSAFVSNVSTGSGRTAITRDDDIFGGGPANIYSQFTDTSSGNSFSLSDIDLGNPTLVTLSFDFYDNNTSGNDSDFVTRLRNNSGGTIGMDFRLNNGNLVYNGGSGSIDFGDYSLETVHSITLIANAGATVTDYLDDRDLASDTFDVYLDGVLVNQSGNLAFRNTVRNLDELFVQSFSGSGGSQANVDMFADNFLAQDVIDTTGLTLVPEPSTYALLAGFLALGLVMLRRRYS